MKQWSREDVLALPVTVDLVTAGSVLGISRSTSYEMNRRGEFPVKVLQLGHRYRVLRADLIEFLHLA